MMLTQPRPPGMEVPQSPEGCCVAGQAPGTGAATQEAESVPYSSRPQAPSCSSFPWDPKGPHPCALHQGKPTSDPFSSVCAY